MINAIFREIKKKRKHYDNTDLMVEINKIVSEECKDRFMTSENIVPTSSIPILRRSADPKLFPGNTFPDLLDYFRRDLFRTTFLIAWLLLGYCFTCSSTLLDHLAFKLCKAQHDMEYQTSGRGVVDQSHVEDVYGYTSIQ